MAAPSMRRKGCQASMLHDARRVELSRLLSLYTGRGQAPAGTLRASTALAATGCSARGRVPPLPTH